MGEEMIPNNFYDTLNAGWWIEWLVMDEQRLYPKHSITAYSNILGIICGHVPRDWNGKKRHVLVNDEKLQEWIDWEANRKKIAKENRK